ncbi:thrombospondin type 3 repeat-containing protein [Pyxidicoccus parkwayensis]|uniref:Thrombospondin type 3 repeat-containing protein n=1 Tax=Pyxidicoccus parkwayensis TaxID=2813578 RepID=A0ABX7NJZ8_9BACT|nr:thrombospondin type 3 repeat-containing protein [Pyxidicoccus parkwaysis]QSQ19185.1 thrombospondin type 3 repeat-containing protein [Pyxidicoccus parkwaysis]
MNRTFILLTGCAVLLGAIRAEADCKLIINVDRTGSMQATRADGQTRCAVAQNSVITILEYYDMGKDFDITKPYEVPQPRAEFALNCPQGPGTAGTRLVQVREFRGSTMKAVWPEGGFKTVEDAMAYLMFNLGWYDNGGRSKVACPSEDTPMAQAMCRAAREFPAGPPPAGEFRMVKTTTDGGENASHSVTLNPGEARCVVDGEPEATWRSRVMNEYASRGIVADSVLWEVGGSTSLRRTVAEPIEAASGEARDAVEVTPRGLGNLAESSDFQFFSALAQATGGRFHQAKDAAPIAVSVSMADSDGDGIPDFRDGCTGASCATDRDNDGILDASDACPFLAEDGLLPSRADGCPDSDSDGIRNGLDVCPNAREDKLAPYPGDGCPAERWGASGAPNLQTAPNNGTVCTSLNMTSATGAASRARLDIAGYHTSGRALSGTLMHNGTTVAAFPFGLLNTDAAPFFQFTNRPIPMPAGAAAGTWTLCLTDISASGGTLQTWAVHD